METEIRKVPLTPFRAVPEKGGSEHREQQKLQNTIIDILAEVIAQGKPLDIDRAAELIKKHFGDVVDNEQLIKNLQQEIDLITRENETNKQREK